jgi:hypothetical protein
MTRYVALLRGVNVGGVNFKMADVAKAFTAAGFTDVKTILASGNVLLTSRSGVTAVREAAEVALRKAFGYDAWVLAYDLDTVRAISEAFPFELRSADTRRTRPPCPHWAGREDRARQGRRVLAGAQDEHARQHDRQDNGQEAVQVLDHYAEPTHRGEAVALSVQPVSVHSRW